MIDKAIQLVGWRLVGRYTPGARTIGQEVVQQCPAPDSVFRGHEVAVKILSSRPKTTSVFRDERAKGE